MKIHKGPDIFGIETEGMGDVWIIGSIGFAVAVGFFAISFFTVIEIIEEIESLFR